MKKSLWWTRVSCLVMLMACSGWYLSAQTYVLTKPTLKTSYADASRHFHDVSILMLGQKGQSKNSGVDMTLELSMPDGAQQTWSLTPSYLLSTDHSISLVEPERLPLRQVQTYVANIKGDPSSYARLSISDHSVYGYIEIAGEQHYIEPLSKFLDQKAGVTGAEHIMYQAKDVKVSSTPLCLADHHKQIENTKEDNRSNQKSGGCELVELAIAIDWSYRQDHGGTSQAIDQSISVMNMVAGSYETSFSDIVRFEITEHYVSNCSSCDPWTSDTDANTLLNDFTSWAPNGFSKAHDLGQLWSNRDFTSDNGSGVAGLAWINAVCGTWRYHILEDYTTSAWQLRVLTAHEIGHNFGSHHDVSGSPHIMAPSISQNTTSWSSTSVTSINSALLDFNCLGECYIGSCTNISNISTSGCLAGSPSTYDLHLTIAHGGGGTASHFNVVVNGSSFQRVWSESPQQVTITGLIADGTKDNVVTIVASDGSDDGCNATKSYDEPTADCSLRVVADFNQCSLPDGWTTASTNNIIWNGGDPNVQYEWKIDNEDRSFGRYNQSTNYSRNQTIDGSCMAVMDDDMFNHHMYEGTVTMTSATYNLSSFTEGTLELDYLFHPFESGGVGKEPNGSYFSIEIYHNNTWEEVHREEDSDCPWNDVWRDICETSPSINITPYLNEDFAMRFIYSDAASWAGMIAMDNIVLDVITVSPPTCNDGLQNGDETGVDCGGPDCAPCVTCDDGIQNGDETGVDCGGSLCEACITCDDGEQNGDETGVDCGGPYCEPCYTCNDGIKNGNEVWVDCGGPDCAPCEGDCPLESEINGNVQDQLFLAQEMIINSERANVTSEVTLSTPEFEVRGEIEIQLEATFEVYNEGCKGQ